MGFDLQWILPLVLRPHNPSESASERKRILAGILGSVVTFGYGAEGRHGLSPEEREAGITEDGALLLYVSRRKGP